MYDVRSSSWPYETIRFLIKKKNYRVFCIVFDFQFLWVTDLNGNIYILYLILLRYSYISLNLLHEQFDFYFLTFMFIVFKSFPLSTMLDKWDFLLNII